MLLKFTKAVEVKVTFNDLIHILLKTGSILEDTTIK